MTVKEEEQGVLLDWNFCFPDGKNKTEQWCIHHIVHVIVLWPARFTFDLSSGPMNHAQTTFTKT